MTHDTDSWVVQTASGLALHLPPSTRSLSTWVMLEQERWFEPEMHLLPHLLRPGMQVLDIGANHGVYALEMARCVQGDGPAGRGQVWAFEPTSAPRARLARSVQDNGLQHGVTVVACALAEAAGSASFAIHANSELNSRDGAGAMRETVALQALDAWLAEHAPGTEIGFIKLDAEGGELQVLAGAVAFFAAQSPVVMFEFQHAGKVNAELLCAWHALGYGIFRWSAELELLLPFDAATAELAFALNLVAVRPQTQAQLAARGLLVTAEALAAEPLPPTPDLNAAALAAWCAQPALRGLPADALASCDADDGRLLAQVAAAHGDAALSPAQRLRSMMAVRDAMTAAASQGAERGPACWSLLVHALLALGAPLAAGRLAAQVLQRWPAGADIAVPVVPPRKSDLARPRSTPLATWLRQMLAEYAALSTAHSAYFMPPRPQRWAALLQHPDHGAEIERRHLLEHVRCNLPAALDDVVLLPDPRHTRNAHLWQGLMASMRPAGTAPATAPETAPETAQPQDAIAA